MNFKLKITLFLLIGTSIFYACSKNDLKPNKITNEEAITQELITNLNNTANKIALKEGRNKAAIPRSIVSAEVNNYIDMYNYILEDIDYILDPTKHSQEAADAGFSLEEARSYKAKIAYVVAQHQISISGEMNYSPEQAINEMNQWEQSSAETSLSESPWITNYGKTIFTLYTEKIKLFPNNNFRYALAEAYLLIVNNSQIITPSEKLALSKMFVSEQAQAFIGTNSSPAELKMGGCQKATIGWLGSTVLTFFVCDGCAVATYLAGAVYTVVECA